MTAVQVEDWRPQGILGLEDRAWEALRETDRCVCVTAGAGAGKTELLAQKAAYLLQTGICPAPRRVLAISFKRDAAATLSARVRLRLPQELSRRFMSLTFDAWTKGLLDQFRLAVPPPYAPAANYDLSFPTRDILNAQIDKLGLDLNRGQLEKLVSATSLPIEEQGLPTRREHALKAYWQDQYEGYPTPFLTFGMLNRLVEFMLRRNEGIRSALRSTYPFVFLDEFQDTTAEQFELVRMAFSPDTTRITTVGDDKQRIMGWAGAMDDGFGTFVRMFDARRVTLFANWRSHEDLVAVQRLVAAHIDPSTEPVEARKARSVDGNACAIWVFEDRKSEVEGVASWLAAEIGPDGLEPHNVVILARQLVNVVEEELRPEFAARGLILRNLARYVGDITIQDLLSEELTTLLLPLLRAAATRPAPEAWSSALERMAALRSSLDGADEELQHRTMREVENLTVSARKFMSEVVPTTGEAEDLVSLLTNAIGEDLIRQATPAYQRGADYQRVLGGLVVLLQECMSASNTWEETLDRFEGKGQVPLMTIHKSKGMEFHTVVFFGLDGSSWRDLASGKREEINSFFVALTRAEQRAFFTCCEARGRRIGWLERLLGDAVPRVAGGPS
jgi:superfamily I DNA/RNA helicase